MRTDEKELGRLDLGDTVATRSEIGEIGRLEIGREDVAWTRDVDLDYARLLGRVV